MRTFSIVAATAIVAAAIGLVPLEGANAVSKPEQTANVDAAGAQDFDFLVGTWRVHHRLMRANREWWEFEGTCANRALVDGSANIEEHTFTKPTGVTYGIALRAYDPKTAQWAIWWVDSRAPHGALDPPMQGRFANGVGTFYSDGMLDGKPTRTRFIWSQITRTSARWEQAYSYDAGKTWETNWIMEFARVS